MLNFERKLVFAKSQSEVKEAQEADRIKQVYGKYTLKVLISFVLGHILNDDIYYCMSQGLLNTQHLELVAQNHTI